MTTLLQSVLFGGNSKYKDPAGALSIKSWPDVLANCMQLMPS